VLILSQNEIKGVLERVQKTDKCTQNFKHAVYKYPLISPYIFLPKQGKE